MMKKISEKVKSHKKYRTISDEIVIEEIKKYLKSNPTTNPNTIHEDRQAIKDIRKQLHLSYSSFQTKKKFQRNKYLDYLKKALEKRNQPFESKEDLEINNITEKLLLITLSTKERLHDYKKLYKQIFKITKQPKTIIDLGCGLNPTSYPYMRLDKVKYLAYDIDEEDINFLNNYFTIMNKHGLNGKAEILNLNNKTKVSNLPNSDVIFLFKVIDIIDKKDHKQSEELIKQIIQKTKHIIASFATKTLTRRKMNFPNRKWFELMLKRNNLQFKTINTDNEIFYIINK